MILLDWVECSEGSGDPWRWPAGGLACAALGECVLIMPVDNIPISA